MLADGISTVDSRLSGEKIISIVDALRSKAFHYTLKESEALGFVFPVYFYTVSDPVLEFVRNLRWRTRALSMPSFPAGRASSGGRPSEKRTEKARPGAAAGRCTGRTRRRTDLLRHRLPGEDGKAAGSCDKRACVHQAGHRQGRGQPHQGKPAAGKSKPGRLPRLHEHKSLLRRREVHRLRKVCLDLPGRGDRNDRRPPGLDEEQMSQVLRLHQPLPRFRDPVREKDSLPRAVRQSGFEVKLKHPERSEPFWFRHLRAFCFFPLCGFLASLYSVGIGHAIEISPKSSYFMIASDFPDIR